MFMWVHAHRFYEFKCMKSRVCVGSDNSLSMEELTAHYNKVINMLKPSSCRSFSFSLSLIRACLWFGVSKGNPEKRNKTPSKRERERKRTIHTRSVNLICLETAPANNTLFDTLLATTLIQKRIFRCIHSIFIGYTLLPPTLMQSACIRYTCS